MKYFLRPAIVLVLAISLMSVGTHPTFAAQSSTLGDQDYADGAIETSNPAWLAAQADDPLPFKTIHAAPNSIVYQHTGLDSGQDGILTFSLWDLDSAFPGNQIAAFSLDGIPQDISQFEVSEPNNSVKVFQIPVDASYFSDGILGVSLTIGEAPNEVGIDFSSVELIPNPDTDNDGVPNDSDNCPDVANPDQLDSDGDLIGDVCDPDDDGDDIPDSCDVDSNPGSLDRDLDGFVDGSECDTEIGPPTDKDQCKNGGWLFFNHPRAFKNQGDCVSFVENGR